MSFVPNGLFRLSKGQQVKTSQLLEGGEDVSPLPGFPDIDKDVPSEEGPLDESLEPSEPDGDSELQGYVFSILEELGVERRQLDSVSKQVYSEETDLQSHSVKGHYMIPTFTKKGQVSKSKATEIARDIGQKFSLHQKIKTEGKNWRVDFQSFQEPKEESHGSSFDDFSSKQASSSKKMKKTASAQTIREMVRDNKDAIVDELKNIIGRN